jgi:hypothetical protein
LLTPNPERRITMATIKIEGNKAIITVDLNDLGPSKSGKTQLVINANGNNYVPFEWKGKTCKLTMTGYYKK